MFKDVWKQEVLRAFDESESEWIVKGVLGGGTVDNERKAKDNFVRRPIIQHRVKQELEKVEKLHVVAENNNM